VNAFVSFIFGNQARSGNDLGTPSTRSRPTSREGGPQRGGIFPPVGPARPISVHSKRFALLHSKYLVHRKSHAEQRVAIALSPESSQFHGFVASIKGAAPSSLIIVRA